MPELPEVETVVRGIRADLVGHTILAAWTDWERGLVTPDSFQHFAARIAGQRVLDVQRRAKFIVIKLEADWLLIHLKMTGRLYVVPNEAQVPPDQWVHFCFQLDGGQQLRFSDSRKFGRVYLTNDLDAIVGHLGPEPLADAFTLAAFRERLARHKGAIKPLLLNQRFLSGVGNIYADEALHRAGILPTRRVESLGTSEIEKLYHAIRQVLHLGIEHQGTTISWYWGANGERGTMHEQLYVYRRAGELCRSCGTTVIEKSVVAQRGTHYCPNCQS